MPGVSDWIKKSMGNLKAAKNLLDDDDTLDSAAYLSQQSAEKALKAYIIFKGVAPLRTHDLEKLLVVCQHWDSSLQSLQLATAILSPYATYTRYPDDRFSIDREEAIEAIEYAEQILRLVKEKVKSDKAVSQLTIFDH